MEYRILHLTRAYDEEKAKNNNREEIEKLKAENAKLNYRIIHLVRALDEKNNQA